MLGGGADFNRIAGPGATPGVYNGVLIAQVNSDISVIEFEQGIRDLVSDVETAYWELQFAYRAYDAIVEARDQALETWRQIETWRKSGLRGGTPQREARAREQYYRFEAELENLLAGQVQERTRATTFRGLGGIYAQERNLRSLMGVPINDGRLIRPVTDPAPVKVVFDWDEVQSEATTSRIEIQRQQMQIKLRELEVVAAKSFLRPQLDAIARYRWRGLGQDLLDPSGNNPPFNDAVQNLVDGNFQEWQLGLEFAAPIGFRQAHAAVRNARLESRPRQWRFSMSNNAKPHWRQVRQLQSSTEPTMSQKFNSTGGSQRPKTCMPRRSFTPRPRKTKRAYYWTNCWTLKHAWPTPKLNMYDR